MSAPGQEFRESEYLGLGLLAVRSSNLIGKLLAGGAISEDDKDTLARAGKFLTDVASGAKLISSGVSSNVSAADSVRKFAYSVEPLRLLQNNIKATDAESILEKIAVSLGESVDAGVSEDRRLDLESAQRFFAELQKFLLGLVESRKRRTGDVRSRTAMSAYA